MNTQKDSKMGEGNAPRLCSHNNMTERKNDMDHAWQCSDCGYVYGSSVKTHTNGILSMLNALEDIQTAAAEPEKVEGIFHFRVWSVANAALEIARNTLADLNLVETH